MWGGGRHVPARGKRPSLRSDAATRNYSLPKQPDEWSNDQPIVVIWGAAKPTRTQPDTLDMCRFAESRKRES